MRKSYVYKIVCKITGEYYFGSSFSAKSDRYWGGGRRIRELITKYGKENFVKEILEEFDDRTNALKKENEYIEKFRNDDKCLNQMLNRRFGSFSDESRTKMGVAHHVENLSDDTRSKLSAANRGEKNPMYGKHLSEEHRSKISAALRGKHLSEETRTKLSAAQRGKPHPHAHRKHWRKNKITGKREYYD